MIELQLLNKILQDGNLDILLRNGIDETYFNKFRVEYDFILNHYNKYNKMPDKQTIIAQPNLSMEFFNVNESETYLISTIREDKLFNNTVDVITTLSDLMVEDSVKAVEFLRAQLPKLTSQLTTSGVDIIKDTTRLDVVKQRASNESAVIKTGLKELDDIIYGWFPGEELATIVARTGQGKTWMLILFLAAAWGQGKRVGMYSGEMSGERIGYRFDTLLSNFSNRGLIRGFVDIDNYEQYIKELTQYDVPFYVITKNDLGGRATVSKLKAFAETHKLDILGIDQYTLLNDERATRGSSTREQLEHLSSDLFDLSCDLGIPILVLSQANRGGVREDKGTPDIENIYGADAIAQNATKVITIRQTGAGLELAIKKNRDDKIGDTLLYFWDIDSGILKYIPNNEDVRRDPTRIETVRNQFKDEKDVF